MRAPLALAAIVVLLPHALAHAAPDPRDQDTRLLEDWNDDCGGDGGAATGACKGSIDVIALDVLERHDPVGDLVAFRFIMDRGQAGSTHTIRLMFDSGGPKTYTMQSSDDRTFTGSFDTITQAVSLNDGTRFAVEATVKRAALAATIANFRVESLAGNTVGDFMPGGCNNVVGSCVDTGQSSTSYVRPEYVLRGPSYYLTMTGPPSVSGEAQVTVTNPLRDSTQAVVLSAKVPAGVEVRFLDQAGQEKATLPLTLTGRQSVPVTLVVRTEEAAAFELEATTDLGGRTSLALLVEPAPTSPTTSPAVTKAAPAGLAVATMALIALARARRT